MNSGFSGIGEILLTGETNVRKVKGQMLKVGMAPGSPEIKYDALLPNSDSQSPQRLDSHISKGLLQLGHTAATEPAETSGGDHWGKHRCHTSRQGRASCLAHWGHFSSSALEYNT